MAAILLKAFSGLKPLIEPKLLSTNDAQTALNTRLISGAIAPMKESTFLKATTLSVPKTIFRYGDSIDEDKYWLEFGQDTDIMRSPIANDQYDRLYWTDGEGAPRYAPNSLILQAGTGPYPRASYLLGVPAPSTAASITAFSAVINYTPVTREYVMTFYSPSSGKESLPTNVLGLQGVDGQKVAFTGLTTDNRGDATVTKKRIYRKLNGVFRMVVELDLSVTTYDDVTTDADLASQPQLAASAASALAAPTRAPSVSAGSTAAPVSGIQRQYVYTICNYSETVNAGDGQYTVYINESQPSAPVSVTADDTQTVTITRFNNTFAGSHYKVYRRDAGTGSYLLVATIPVSQASLQDPLGTTTLGPPVSSDGSLTPSGALTASASSSTGATGTLKAVYMVTWIDGSGNQSSKGPVSAIVSVTDNSAQVGTGTATRTTVSVTHTEAIPAGVTKKRVYRQDVTTDSSGQISLNDANWKMVAEVTASTTSVEDSKPNNTLGGAPTYPTALANLPPTPGGSASASATIPPKEIPEARTYVYTFVSAYGEEGPPSPASDVVDLDPEQPVTVSLPSSSPGGNYNLTLKRIYRSSTVGSQAQFQFVDEIPIGTTSYVDSKKQADLGEILPSENWNPPPVGLKGLRLMANGAAVGFKEKTLYFSEPNLPHAWPHEYSIDDNIVAIGVFGQTVAVLTERYPYLFQGIDPAAMSSTKLLLPQACVSKRSTVETGDGVIYASADGLVSVGMANDVISKNIYSRAQWQALNPSSMETHIYNGKIHITYSNNAGRGILVFDLSGQGAVLTTNNVNAAQAINAGYYDARSDTLYLARAGGIYRFDHGTPLTYTWRSKLFRLEFPTNFSFGQVRASAYPVTMKVYADGQLRFTKTVTNANQFRLPSGFRAYDWELQIEGTSEISEMGIAQSSVELKSA